MRAAWSQGIEAEGSEGLGECVDRLLEIRGFSETRGSERVRAAQLRILSVCFSGASPISACLRKAILGGLRLSKIYDLSSNAPVCI